jgi:hypothetical protein
MSGPADKARFGQFEQAVVVWSSGLLRIGGDDFKVPTGVELHAGRLAEREQSVACAASGMDAAECGWNTGALFDELDAAIEIVATEKEVIKHDGRFSGSPGNRWRGQGAPG